MSEKDIVTFPVQPLPAIWDPAQRLEGLKQSLRESLDPQHPLYLPVPARTENLRAVINAYESGKIPKSGKVYFIRGKIVSEEEAAAEQGVMVWVEVRYFKALSTEISSLLKFYFYRISQRLKMKLKGGITLIQVTNIRKTIARRWDIISKSQRSRISWVRGAANRTSSKISSSLNEDLCHLYSEFYFQLLLQIRLCVDLGGDTSTTGINLLNDTGSDVLTLFTADLQRLGNFVNYQGWVRDAVIGTANGTQERLPSLLVEARFVDPQTFIAWGPWFREQAIIRHLVPGVQRLSGSNMRNQFYFGTGPGNQHVAVSTSKTRLSSIIWSSKIKTYFETLMITYSITFLATIRFLGHVQYIVADVYQTPLSATSTLSWLKNSLR